jgi:antirestriction protein ArdC
MRKAFYSVSNDTISLPAKKDFINNAEYYAALFHELSHATGHRTRLDRASIAKKNGFGTDPYCKEELIAEIGATFLCGHAGIIDRTINNSAAYLQEWLKRLRGDVTLIVKAAAQAEKAVNFILGVTPYASKKEKPDSAKPTANVELPQAPPPKAA